VYLYFSGPHGLWSVYLLHLKMEFHSCARGRQRCGIIHYYRWTTSIKPRLLFSHAGYASWGFSLSSVQLYLNMLALYTYIHIVGHELSCHCLFCFGVRKTQYFSGAKFMVQRLRIRIGCKRSRVQFPVPARVFIFVLLWLCFYFFPKTHELSQDFAISFATLIY